MIGMVFVPAIMGAGLIFSVATILRDVVSRGSRTMTARRARTRGRMVAETVVDPSHPNLLGTAGAASRPVFALVGLLAAVFAVYVTIGATANFLRSGGYSNRIAWLWAANLLVVVAALVFASACFAVVSRYERPPAWVWPLLVPSPLLGARGRRDGERLRWVVITALCATWMLTILATWPHVLEPFDSRGADLIDAPSIASLDTVTGIFGSTKLTLAIAVLVGVATLRCKRFAWVFIASVAVSLLATALIRSFVDRPRPAGGPMAGAADSYPSGHMVQITLLAVLVPLAVHEMTRSRTARTVANVVLSATVALVAVGRIAGQLHEPSDVLAGMALGLAVGCWARLALVSEGAHSDCTACLYAPAPNRPGALSYAVSDGKEQ